MKSFTHGICYKQMRSLAASTVLVLLFSASAHAQFRNYGIVYSDNIQGSTAMFGNTLEAIYKTSKGVNTVVDTAQMNGTRANGNTTSGNDNSNMQFVDIDGSTGIGAATYNSSSADLALPAGTNNIKFARLYWGGRVLKSDYDVSLPANQSIKMSKGAGSYFTFGADHIDDTLAGSGSSAYYQYQAYSDITTTIQNNGAGTYTVANVPLTPGSISNGGYYGGWCIVVVYENTTAFTSYNSVRVYDGYQVVFNGGSPTLSTVTLTGLNVPSGALSLRDAKMGVMGWEGDGDLTGDSLRINNNYFSNAVNPIDNIFNGSITDSGTFVHSKNPDYTNQMSIDIDQFYVGTGFGIQPDDQTVTLAFRTEADQYFPGLFTFVIKTKTPNPILIKKVTDANGNHIADAGEVLTYDITGQNTGVGNANFTVISDTLTNAVTYVPGSLKVIYSPGITAGTMTDVTADDQGEYISNGTIHTVRFRVGTGANGSVGGTLVANDSFHVQFKVTVNTPAAGGTVPPIVNVARVIAYSDANVASLDDATAIIDPQGAPLPITLVSFAVSLPGTNETKVSWSTSMEISCKEFYVERSEDGLIFNTVATVAGHGSTATQNSYAVSDDITAVNSSVVYYRLAQVDVDGKINYSRVIAVKLKGAAEELNVSPNPFSSYINISLDWNKTEIATAKIYNIQGAIVATKNIQLNKGSNYVSIDELSGLPSGNYLVQINSSNGSMVKKITKQ